MTAATLTASEVMERVDAAYRNAPRFEADLQHFEMRAGSNTAFVRTGRGRFSAVGSFQLDYQHPPYLQTSDGSAVRTIDPIARTNVTVPIAQTEFPVIFGFMIGMGTLARDFQGELHDSIYRFRDGHRLSVTPLRPHSSVARVALLIDQGTFFVREMQWIDVRQNRYRYVFRNTRTTP
jgi:hypothetical protein